MKDLILIAHNLRSSHNVGSLIRTSEGLGIKQVYLTGYTPYPKLANDDRLPHLAAKLDQQIHKTALGAEKYIDVRHYDDVIRLIKQLKEKGYVICGLEQSKDSVFLDEFKPPEKIVLIVGREVEGIEPEVLKQCDQIIEIKMYGKKESFNVVQAAAMALYYLQT